MASKRQFCTFYLDELYLGVPVEGVQELIRAQEITPVPLASAVVRGLINLRGQIVTAIDPRPLLGRSKNQGQPMNVVMQTAEGAFSLLVDRVGDVLEVDDASFERPPDNLDGLVRTLIRGAYKLDGRLLLELDVDKLASTEMLGRAVAA